MNIKFKDNTEISPLVVFGDSRFFQNAQRSTLEFVFAKGDYTLEELDAYFTDPNKTNKVTIVNDSDEEFIYDDYSLRVSMSLAPVVITPETSTEPAVTEERITIVMAQKTYIEKMIEQLLAVQ